ncbi:MAG TPA: nucleotide sugar dehydrogenase [Polyangiaceae bacterium]|nr:nucleotide sugar dehydrogenase [Polyangiaceae bacterium]
MIKLEAIAKINDKSAHIVVVGIGYVGLPLVVEFARAGYHVTGYDKDPAKVHMLNSGESYIGDIASQDLAPFVKKGLLRASDDPAVLKDADAVVVCVPTPLNKTKDPDMRFIVSATEEIAAHQHKGMLIVLESTTYPGTTREVLVPKLTRGYDIGKDVFVAFSPERVDPGNTRYHTRNTPKVIGGTTPDCLEVAQALYARIIDTVVPVTSTDSAEMVKLLENTFRAVNIALVNEVAMMSRRLGIDAWEVIRAAATKPFGFMPFFPGPGLGGHCIPVDPLYLSWKLRTLKFQARFIELADAINSAMPEYVVSRVTDALNNSKKAVRGAKILVAGVAYKPDVSDVRESPAFDVIAGLLRLGGEVAYVDPHVPEIDEAGPTMRSVSPFASFAAYDAVVVITNHRAFDYQRMIREAQVIVDTRDALRDVPGDRSKVFAL